MERGGVDLTSNYKYSGRTVSMQIGILWSAGISLCCTILAILLLGWLVSEEKIKWEYVGYGIMIVTLLSSFLGALIACIKVRRRMLLVSMVSGMLYLGILLSIAELFFGGISRETWILSGIIMVGSLCASFLRMRAKK